MCGLAAVPDLEQLAARPDGIHQCGRCAVAIGRTRRQLRRAEARAARERHRDPLRDLPRPADPEQADRHDRAWQRGTSVRTVAGGLPTLGKQH